jgi:ATP-dependent DNA helicase RecQ
MLTESGRAVMKAERPVRLLLPPTDTGRVRVPRPSGVRFPRPEADALSGEEAVVFEALRAHRLGLARGQGVPPYVIASDRTLREMASLRPGTLRDLLLVHGIGQAKADRYGRGFLDVIRGVAPGRTPAP